MIGLRSWDGGIMVQITFASEIHEVDLSLSFGVGELVWDDVLKPLYGNVMCVFT